MKVQYSPEDNVLDIRCNNVFEATFTMDTVNSRDSLAALISAAINIPVAVVEITQNEQAPGYISEKHTQLNILCRSDNGQLVNVQLTMYPDQFEPFSIEFFTCKLHTSQEINNINDIYTDLRHTYQIIILSKRTLMQDQMYYHHFQYFDSEAGRELGGRTHIVTVELSKVDSVAEKDAAEMSAMERWAVFLRFNAGQAKRELVNQILKLDEGISMAAETLLNATKDFGSGMIE